jgi:hypothetical protein
MRAKLGAPKAITAAAHKLARIIFHLVSTRQEFDDSKFAADQLRYQKRQEAKLHAKAKSMGYATHPPRTRGLSSLEAEHSPPGIAESIPQDQRAGWGRSG